MNNKNFKLPSKKKQDLYNTLNNYNDKINDNKIINTFNLNLSVLSENYKRNLMNKIITNNMINKILLTYELINYNNQFTFNKQEELIKFLKYCFNRYTYKAYGYLLKSEKWKIKKRTDKYVVFYNLINEDNFYDSDTKELLNNLFNFFNRNINDYNIYLEKYYLKRDRLYYIFFIFMVNG